MHGAGYPWSPSQEDSVKGLSPKQRQALEAILRSLRQRGMPPILDEIAEAIGVKSRFGAFRHTS